MSHSLYQFNTTRIENFIRAVDSIGALCDNFKPGTISEAVARKAAIEVVISDDCAPTARHWTKRIENHDRNDLEQMSLLAPGDGPLVVRIVPEDSSKRPPVASAVRVNRLRKAS